MCVPELNEATAAAAHYDNSVPRYLKSLLAELVALYQLVHDSQLMLELPLLLEPLMG